GFGRCVREFGQIMPNPLIAEAVSPSRVESFLPVWVRAYLHEVDQRPPELPQRLQQPFAALERARVAYGNRRDRTAIQLGWKRGGGRRLAHRHPNANFVRGPRVEVAHERRDLRQVLKWMEDQPGEHICDRSEAKLEARHDAEIAAAPADRPEEIGVGPFRSRDNLAVSSH